jgi:phosphoserine phosphatase
MRWPPFEDVFFDCDSTLTTVEGIDILAERLGKGREIRALTEAAMDGAVDLRAVYGRRLDAIGATRADVRALREVYKKHVVEDAAAVIATLQSLGHSVYVVSGGLLEPVMEFALWLGVSPRHVRAVGVDYDELSGDWWRRGDGDGSQGERRYLSYHAGALSESDGKAAIVREISGGAQRRRSLLVGDGVSDLLAQSAVDLFVGYGGVAIRGRVKEEAPVFFATTSLAPVLVLVAGPAGIERARDEAQARLFEKALRMVREGALAFNDAAIGGKFRRAWESSADGAANLRPGHGENGRRP